MNPRICVKVAVAGLAFLLTTSCGKKGPLVPPEALVPAPISDLRAEQKGERFHLSWSAPEREVSGKPLQDLAGFSVFRREVLPPGEDCEECPSAYRLLRTVDLEYPLEVRRHHNLFILSDPDLLAGKTYQYKVISFRRDGAESDASSKVRRKKVASPPAPPLRALSSPTGVFLQWEEVAPPQGGTLLGYNLYRKRADGVMPPFPMKGAPVQGSGYEDLSLERGVRYLYGVRSVARVDGETVESELSNEVEGALTAPE